MEECFYCHGVFFRIRDHQSVCAFCGTPKYKKPTNEDMIRKMNKGELVAFLDSIINNHNEWYNKDIKQWLEEEVSQ